MSNPARIVVVGCGAVTERYHGPALRSLVAEGEVRVIALVDPRRELSERLAVGFGDAACFERLDEVAQGTANVAIVASPPRLHAEQSIRALESGLAVLCEKPLAVTVAEGEAMVAAAAAAQRPLAVGLIRRFLPAARAIGATVHDRLLGEVRSVKISEGGLFAWPARSASFFDRSDAGGGVLADVGVHVLDLLDWWLGPPETVRAATDAMGGVETTCEVELAYATGAMANVRLSRDVPLPNRCEIRFERGAIVWNDVDAERIDIRVDGSGVSLGARASVEDGPPRFRFEDAFVAQLRNVLAACRGDAPLVVPAADALASLRAVERCARERELLPMPWLTREERERARALSARLQPC